jgi:phosphotriesterase-related protein
MIQTVLGPIPGDRLGVTSTHEHLLVDLSGLQKVPVEASRRAKFYAPVTMDLLGSINFGGQTNLDNSRLLDIETAIGETTLFRRAGGDTIVEATSIGIGRDPQGLRQIARATGLNIVMGPRTTWAPRTLPTWTADPRSPSWTRSCATSAMGSGNPACGPASSGRWGAPGR